MGEKMLHQHAPQPGALPTSATTTPNSLSIGGRALRDRDQRPPSLERADADVVR